MANLPLAEKGVSHENPTDIVLWEGSDVCL